MEKEFVAKSLDMAKDNAKVYFAQMGIPEYYVDFEILETPQKGFFGRIKGNARVRSFVAKDNLETLGLDENGKPVQKSKENCEPKKENPPQKINNNNKKPVSSQPKSNQQQQTAKTQPQSNSNAKPNIKEQRHDTRTKKPLTQPTVQKKMSEKTSEKLPEKHEHPNNNNPELIKVERAVFDTEGFEAPSLLNTSLSEAKNQAQNYEQERAKINAERVAKTANNNARKRRKRDIITYESNKELFDKTKKYIENILLSFGLTDAKVTIKEASEYPEIDFDCPVFELETKENSVVIGKHGETLDAIQYLATLASANEGADSPRARFRLNCNGYRQKRVANLKDIADKASKTVLERHRRVFLDPMPPEERRIIHGKVNTYNNQGVFSDSTGEEPYRKVVVYFKNGPEDTFNPKADYRKGGFGHSSGRRPTPSRSGERRGSYPQRNTSPRRTTSDAAPVTETNQSQDSGYSDFATDFEKNAGMGKLDF